MMGRPGNKATSSELASWSHLSREVAVEKGFKVHLCKEHWNKGLQLLHRYLCWREEGEERVKREVGGNVGWLIWLML